MRVTVLGKSPSWQDAGGACSGYLIESGGFRLLLDCGNGVFAKLRQVCDYGSLDAIVLSHLHGDHVLDLVPLSNALQFSGRSAERRPRLVGPPGARGRLKAFVASLWGSEDGLGDAFEQDEYDPADTLRLGPLTLRFCEVPHFVTTFAVELREDGGGRFTFGADCGPSAQLVEFARGTELLMLEATLGAADPPAGDFRGHMTAAEAGALARAACARRLVLTHFSDELDTTALRVRAAGAFEAEPELATEGMQLHV